MAEIGSGKLYREFGEQRCRRERRGREGGKEIDEGGEDREVRTLSL